MPQPITKRKDVAIKAFFQYINYLETIELPKETILELAKD